VRPRAPLADQARIVVQLDWLGAIVEALWCLQIETTTELDALMPAVLSEALAGNLENV